MSNRFINVVYLGTSLLLGVILGATVTTRIVGGHCKDKLATMSETLAQAREDAEHCRVDLNVLEQAFGVNTRGSSKVSE